MVGTESADWQRLLRLCRDEEMVPSRFCKLWAATAIRLDLPFSEDGETWVEDSTAAWQEWADTQGAMRPKITL